MRDYSSICYIDHKLSAPLKDVEVVVEEKIDGSQISFGMFGGKLVVKSKNRQMSLVDAGMFTAAYVYLDTIKHKMVDGWVYRGEYLQKSKHNVLAYDRIPKNHIVLYDVELSEGNYLISRDMLEQIGQELDLEVTPRYYQGKFNEFFGDFLTRTSILGGPIEGVVIKAYNRDLFGKDKKPIIAKMVSNRFKETKKTVNPPRESVFDSLSDTYATEARFRKGAQHLKEAGVLTGTPKDIPLLLKEVASDVLLEESDSIKNTLFDHYMKDVIRAVRRGVPEWYLREIGEQ